MARLILLIGLMAACASGLAGYRVGGPHGERLQDDPRVLRFLDPATGRLRLLVYDANADGHFETWSYMDGSRVLRIEADDGDGTVDRRQP